MLKACFPPNGEIETELTLHPRLDQLPDVNSAAAFVEEQVVNHFKLALTHSTALHIACESGHVVGRFVVGRPEGLRSAIHTLCFSPKAPRRVFPGAEPRLG